MPLDADRLHAEAVVVDMHCDTVIQMKRGYDISKRHATYHIDLPRLKAGGVNLQVFAGCYAPWSSGNAFEVIDRGIDLALGVFSVHSDQMGVCRTASEADKVISSGRLAAMLAIEGGIALEDDPSRVEYFHRRGIRLLTLAHDLPNNWCVNWKDKKPAIDGLNELGREIIGEMNRLGMIIDLSHSAESTFDKVLEVSERRCWHHIQTLTPFARMGGTSPTINWCAWPMRAGWWELHLSVCFFHLSSMPSLTPYGVRFPRKGHTEWGNCL